MAPRRRVGGTRRDAALDAMRAFGFDDTLIRKTLNHLLKVYGRDGWAFIETDCYKVLIDAILETLDQKQLEQDHDKLIDNQSQQDNDNLIELQPEQYHFAEILPDLLITDHPHVDERQPQDGITLQINESEVASGDRALETSEQVLQAEVHFAVRNCSEHQKQLEQDHSNLTDNHLQQDNDNLIELHPDEDHFTEVLADLITDSPHIDEPQDQDEITPQINELEVACEDGAQETMEQVLQAEVHFAGRKCSEPQAINPNSETCVADDIANGGADILRRKPYFGWISDEEEDDYIILKRSDQ